MAEKSKPNPEPSKKKPLFQPSDPAEAILGGQRFRGEVTGCPTGLSGLHRRPEADTTEEAPADESTTGGGDRGREE
jgi:hypothetical protein